MNKFILHGRLVRDPELTKGQDANKDRTNFTVAVDRRYGDETDFFDCVIFGKRAGVVATYFNKGSEILLTGEGQIRSYEDRNGVKRKAFSVVVSDFEFCGSRKDSKAGSVPDPAEPATDGFEDINADIPF